MRKYQVPTKDEVSENNQQIFAQLENNIGFVPNLYAYYTKSETALADYLTLQNRKSGLSKKEREVVNLVVSQYNECEYCLSAHTVIAGMNGFTPDQILSIRSGRAPFDEKLNALARFTLEAVKTRGQVSEEIKESFFAAGYDEGQMVDMIINVGDKIISNYVHNLTKFEIDFPVAQPLNAELV